MEQEQDLGLSANEDVQSLRESLNAQHEKRTLYLRAFMNYRTYKDRYLPLLPKLRITSFKDRSEKDYLVAHKVGRIGK